jgi:ribose-phosphate pyrophosphokinase
MKLFGLNRSKEYAQRVAAALGVDLAPHEERDFGDGEFKIRALESVRDDHVYVCQSLVTDGTLSVHDKLCRLLFFCGALKDAAAARVTAVVPYLAYARKDQRTKPRDPLTLSYIARMFDAVGIDGIVTLDAHNVAALENAFRCRKEHLEASALFAEHFARRASAAAKIVVLSPDAGGVKRARAFAALLAERTQKPVDLAFLEKERSGSSIAGGLFAGDVSDAFVIVFDDMIASGVTVARAAAACGERGADSVHVAATHGLFTPGAAQALGNASLSSIVVTDSVGNVRERCEDLSVRIEILDSAPLFARSIDRWARAR